MLSFYFRTKKIVTNAQNHLSYLPAQDDALVRAIGKKIAEKIIANIPNFITNERLPEDEEEEEEDTNADFERRKAKYFEEKKRGANVARNINVELFSEELEGDEDFQMDTY